MPAEIHKQVLDYQGGDANAALELVEKFKPLIKRYAFFLHREDSFEDLQRFLLSMLKTWDTSRLSSTDDATVTRYIANSVKNEYIALSKQKAKERGTSYLEDATLPQALEYAQKTSTCDQYDQLTLQDLHRSNSCCNDRPAAWGSGARICTTPKTTARRSYCGRRRIRKPRRARRPRCRPSRLPLFPAADGAKNKRPLPPRGPTVSR